jgi:hypothetical protein
MVRECLQREETRFNGKDLSCFRMAGRWDGVIVCYVWWRVNRDVGRAKRENNRRSPLGS